MPADVRSDLERLDRALLRLRRFFEAPAVLDDGGSPLELSTLLVLDAVTSEAEVSTVRDVARRLGVAHSTASRFVTRAEKASTVMRTPSGDDRRETVVQPTDAGRAVAARAAGFRLARLAGITDAWEPHDITVLARLLEQFALDGSTAEAARCGGEQHEG